VSSDGSDVEASWVGTLAKEGGWKLSAELVQRFVMAAGWKDTYHGVRYSVCYCCLYMCSLTDRNNVLQHNDVIVVLFYNTIQQY
jgi:hypothetical protein